jgi:hypothetical protein
MPKYVVAVAISLATILLGSTCPAKDLGPVEPAKAQNVKLPIKGRMVKVRGGGAPLAAVYKLFDANGTSYDALYPEDLTVGTAGVFAKYDAIAEFRVISVADESNLIVEYDHRIEGALGADGRAPAPTKHHYISLWLKGFSTKGVVDDDKVTIPWVVNVTGTKKYTTGAGTTSTVLLIEPHQETDKERQAREAAAQEERQAQDEAAQKERHTKEEAARKERQAKDEAAQKRQREKQADLDRKAAAEEARWRVWTDASGTHTIEAHFRYMIGDQVKLLKRDGTEISVPLKNLSEEDRGWIKNRKKIQ